MQLPFSILQVLVSLTEQSDSRKNSLGLVDLFQDAHVGALARMADLMGYSEAELKTQMSGVAFKAQQSEPRASRQPLSSELAFNHQGKLDFRALSWELMTRGHSADGMLFAALFLPESERSQLFSAFLKQQGYSGQGPGASPMYTAIAIMTGNVDELFEADYLDAMVQSWRLHVALVLKALPSGQSSAKYVKAKEFLTRLADQLLLRNDIEAYLSLSILADSFSFTHLQDVSRTNLMNVDLRVNSLITILTKLRHKATTDKNERSILLANMVSCAFYRAICFGQVLRLHEKALEEIHFVVEHRNDQYLPQRLRKSNYFEFLLTQMKQTSFENMRSQQQPVSQTRAGGASQATTVLSLSGAKKQSSSTSSTIKPPTNQEQQPVLGVSSNQKSEAEQSKVNVG